jgi:predicted ABC-type ATPase
MQPPDVIALAGPNGAGKSTIGPPLLKEALGVTEFVNADLIAAGLSAFRPEGVALAAGKIMLARLRELAAQRASFAFETTLAGRRYVPWLTQLIESGYSFHLVFLWLPHSQFAVSRVEDRVRRGGHSVPVETIHRRYAAGLRNFFSPYRLLATTWRMYDNSGSPPPRLVATGTGKTTSHIYDEHLWQKIQRLAGESDYGGQGNI